MRMLLVRGEAVRTQPSLPPACKAGGGPRAGARGGRAPDRTAAQRAARVTYPRIAPVLTRSPSRHLGRHLGK
jgi:hypothetical protein